MSPVPPPGWWSWADIIQRADRLGIPNFQRGAVWDSGNRVALLESIYEQSPCGSFVLWTPTLDAGAPERHGVALHRFSPSKTPLWLVDGQQRTRAMLDTYFEFLEKSSNPGAALLVRQADLVALRSFGCAAAAPTPDYRQQSDDLSTASPEWFAVLPAMTVFDAGRQPYFGRHSESRNIRRGSMFRRLQPRARTRLNSDGKLRPVPPLPPGLVPLAALVSPEGVFNRASSVDNAVSALQAFDTDRPDLSALDDLLPWGPQFVTGHAYEGPSEAHPTARPLSWQDIHVRRHEAGVAEMTQCLAGLFEPQWAPVFQRFEDMLTGSRFAVGHLPPSDISAAIDAYVRINRAGIRVRAEERALALLSRARAGLLDDLSDFMQQRDGGASIADQRALLTHESDRQMGFGVWIATVTRYTALSILGEGARRWLGVSAVDKDTFGYRLDRVGPNETDAGTRTWARPDYAAPGDVIRDNTERASEALLLLDSVLSDELHLDHRMARPASRTLYPMLDLLYRVPTDELRRLRGDCSFRAAVARMLHWTLLCPYLDQSDLERLIVTIHGIDEDLDGREDGPLRTWGDQGSDFHASLRAALGRYQGSLLTIWRRKHIGLAARENREPVDGRGMKRPGLLTELAVDAFAREVRLARSLQHRAVGWLYAIERRSGAAEFCWDAQAAGYKETGGKVGVPVATAQRAQAAPLQRCLGVDELHLYPEKQHIIPFVIARQIADKGGTRATASPANAIGNLTWLSRRQNGLDALADRWTVMDPERDGDNLKARGMHAAVPDEEGRLTALDLYQELSNRLLAAPDAWRQDREHLSRLMEKFCAVRSAWMVKQMRQWLEEPIATDAEWWLSHEIEQPFSEDRPSLTNALVPGNG